MSAFTPGPWDVARHSPADVVAGNAESNLHLASARCGLSNDLTREAAVANARLIAAAPELLEALQLAYRHLNGGSDSLTPMEFDRAFKLARAAIAKATGVQQ